jgi:hypothetical protein
MGPGWQAKPSLVHRPDSPECGRLQRDVVGSAARPKAGKLKQAEVAAKKSEFWDARRKNLANPGKI